MAETLLPDYGWVIVSLLGGLLFSLIFVLGTNLLLGTLYMDTIRRRAVLKAVGRKCGYVFAALLAFGVTVFLAFPLIFETVFSGGLRTWGVLVAAIAAQWIAYLICNLNGNLLGSRIFRIFLLIIGFLAPFFLGTAIGTCFTGAEFTVDRTATPAVVTWTGAWHGLEALTRPLAVLLGLVVVCLSVILGALYIIRAVDDHSLRKQMRRSVRVMTIPFLVLFIVWFVLLMFRRGFSVDADGVVSMEKYKYLMNLLHHRPMLVEFAVGIVLVLVGLYLGVFTKSRRKGFWFTLGGTVLVVAGVFFLAGFHGTAFYPSLTDLQSSLTIWNTAAGGDTLQTLFWASLSLPFLVAGLGYLWHRTDHRKKISVRGLERKDAQRQSLQ